MRDWGELPEVAWRGASREQLRRLHLVLIGRGTSNAVADGIVGWLTTEGDRGSATLARYRRVLREVGPPKPLEPLRARHSRTPGRAAGNRTLDRRGESSLERALEARMRPLELPRPRSPVELPGDDERGTRAA